MFNGDLTVEAPIGKLKECPCCGSGAEFKGVLQYTTPGVQICCPKCRVRTSPVTTGMYIFYKGKPNVTFTLKEAIDEVISTWNNRITIEPFNEGGDANE